MNWVNKERLAECLDVSIRSVELRERNGLVLTLFGYAVAGNNQAKLKQKAHELAKVMNYQDIEIGIAIGILRQRNLIPSRS